MWCILNVLVLTCRYAPRQYDAFQEVMLVLDFHGYSGSAINQEEESGWRSISDKYNFIVVWPDGVDDTIGKLFDVQLPCKDVQSQSWNTVLTCDLDTVPYCEYTLYGLTSKC